MNKMYKYLRDHNYISRNENKDALRQQELSRERAECIANKYDNLTEKLQQENKNLKDNWNKLKSWVDYMRTNTLQQNNYGRILDKMQELEQGSDSNGQ